MSGSSTPWWWLRDAECRALGIGPGARRTDLGVLFGDGRAPLRLEIVPREAGAPATVGEVSLRVWGDAAHPRARLVIAAAARFLTARRGEGFDPGDPSLPLPGATETRSSGTETRSSQAPDAPPTIIDIPSVCERACLFCGISKNPIELRRPRGLDADVERAIEVAPGPILFTGDDALGSPRIVEWVRRAAAGGRRVAVIGPPRAGLTAALAPRLAEAGLRRWHTGIFGPDAELHDRVVGLAGAFDALLEAAAAMRAAGVIVELLTTLVTPILPSLAATARRAAEITSEPLTVMAYAPDTVVGHAFDGVVPPWDAVREALAAVDDARVRIDGVPLCVLPPRVRARGAGRLARTDDTLGVLHPSEPCAACTERARCPGVGASSLRAVGAVGLVAFGAGPART